MIRLGTIACILILIAVFPFAGERSDIKVGSKKFTESVVLGEIVTALINDSGATAMHYRELGGTRLVFQSLLQGDIDLYPEYTGTIAQEILGRPEADFESMRKELASQEVEMSRPLGFNNTYALAMLKPRAEQLQIESVSDLVTHPELVFRFSSEFMDREDGWPNLQAHYGLPQRDVAGMDHDLAYRQLELGAIDLIDVYSTDAKIDVYDLCVLEDDRQYFPRYDCVLLYRQKLEADYPAVVDRLHLLESSLSGQTMVMANRKVEVDRASEAMVASEVLQQTLAIESTAIEESRFDRVVSRTLEHLDLVRKSLIPAILLAVPLGIIAAKKAKLGQVVLAVVGIFQTIPSLALLVMLMPVVATVGLASVGLGSATAVFALLLYSLLPIVRNTHAGLRQIDPRHHESAIALGLPGRVRLIRIELPLASPAIIAGIKTAAVINVGFATLGALIGAGGYGQPIISGIRLNDTGLILEGAIPAAVLALLVQAAFEFAERWIVPRGLRI